jgi:ankyrin repeat protein
METKISDEEEKRYEELQFIALDYAREGKTIELDKMISYGMPVNLCTNKNDTLLMLATYNGNYETSLMLIKRGADLNRVNQRKQTPLEGVCFKGYLEIVKLLVESGANISRNSITYASVFGHKDIVKYLKKTSPFKKYKILGIDLEVISLIMARVKYFFKIVK